MITYADETGGGEADSQPDRYIKCAFYGASHKKCEDTKVW